MKVLVIGLGSLGTMVVKCLKGLGLGEIVLVDDDKVESHNFRSCLIYEKCHVGKYKVDVILDFFKGKDFC